MQWCTHTEPTARSVQGRSTSWQQDVEKAETALGKTTCPDPQRLSVAKMKPDPHALTYGLCGVCKRCRSTFWLILVNIPKHIPRSIPAYLDSLKAAAHYIFYCICTLCAVTLKELCHRYIVCGMCCRHAVGCEGGNGSLQGRGLLINVLDIGGNSVGNGLLVKGGAMDDT